MTAYDGIGHIVNGGAEIERLGMGGEMWNFRVENRRCYGYAMSVGFSGVNLNRLLGGVARSRGDKGTGIDVIFFATKPGVGQVVIGWYLNATVFHTKYYVRKKAPVDGDRAKKIHYLCRADARDAFLLAEEDRTFRVPYAPAHGRGFPGMSNIFYPDLDSDQPEVMRFLGDLQDYVRTNTKARRGNIFLRRRPITVFSHADAKRNALNAAESHLTAIGYDVYPGTGDNCGWDLEALRGEERLLVSVKGLVGNTMNFELTSTEFAEMQRNEVNYRVFVLPRAQDSTELQVYLPLKADGEFELIQEDGDNRIRLFLRIAARAFLLE